MTTDVDVLVKVIGSLPRNYQAKVVDFIGYPKQKIDNKPVANVTLASQEALSSDWLLPEEDAAWADL